MMRRLRLANTTFPTPRCLTPKTSSAFNFTPKNPGQWDSASSKISSMLAKRIIPCLDVTGGRVVKGVNFVGLRDAGDPVELADRYNRQGADELVFLDITASSDNRDTMADVVARTARQVFIPLTVGGGIRSVADARKIILAGADKVSVNTSAVRRPELISELSVE